MGFIQNIKDKLGNRKIKKILRSQKRKVRVTNFSYANSIGIIYPVSTLEYQDVIVKYVDYLREEVGFKKIIALGYCKHNELPTFVDKDLMKYSYFTKKSLTFSQSSNSDKVKDFIQKDFDILIDVSKDYQVPIKHVVASSRALFKIGRYSQENEKFFDFMLEMKSDTPLGDFLEQVNKFLIQVKPKK